VTTSDFTTILDECRGIREGVQAAWQRMRDRRLESIVERHPKLIEAHGIETVRDAVGIAVAGLMLRADADICRELGRVRGLSERNAHRCTVRLMEVET